MNLEYPDLSIVGAPKCGTSSLHSWLGRQEGVCPAQPKETFYFMDPEHPWLNPGSNFHKDETRAYKRFFNQRRPGKTLDSTTHYYYQRTAIEQFSAAGTRVCMVLRDPTKRLLSYFQYVCLTRGAVTRPICFGEFARGLLEGDVSKFRVSFIDDKEFYTLQSCLIQGHYVDYVRAWQREINKDNLLIILFEDLVTDRECWLQRICDFFDLKVSPENIQNFKRENETVGIKYPRLNRIVKAGSRLLANERLKQMLKGLYMKFQKTERPVLDADYQSEINRLYEHYEPYNRALGDLLEIDLSRWAPPLSANKN